MALKFLRATLWAQTAKLLTFLSRTSGILNIMQFFNTLRNFYINLTHARPQYSINDAATIYQVMNDFHHKINDTARLVTQLAEEIATRDKKLTALINTQTGAMTKQGEADKALILEQIKIISEGLQQSLTQSNALLLKKISGRATPPAPVKQRLQLPPKSR